MRGRTYLAVIVLSWALVVLWAVYWALEGRRMEATARAYTEQLIAQGTILYAENCVICHGPLGEGVVGPRLSRQEFRGDPNQDRETYDLLYNTVSRGRPGSVVPRWQQLPNGELASFTQMPAWSTAHGGPLNEQGLRAIVYFLMAGKWSEVNAHIPPAKVDGELPDARGVPAEINEAGKRLVREKLCITCHTLGSTGGKIGPDLTYVGAWGVDAAFLKEWISDPPAKANRAPVWFSNYGGIDSSGTPSGVRIDYGPTVMPKLPMTEEELDILVQYLLGLK